MGSGMPRPRPRPQRGPPLPGLARRHAEPGDQAVPHTATLRSMDMTEPLSLSLTEWVVLGVIGERPAHGFAVAALTSDEGDLGRIWHIPRPAIYRALGRVEADGLVAAEGVEPGRGPQRTIYAITPPGREALETWLRMPVWHVRDVRSHLLMKLALLDRAGRDPADLLVRQRAVLEPIVAAIRAERSSGEGFDAVLLAWRRATASAALSFLDDITPSDARSLPRRPQHR
jgi:DNA-binding PadR family transcriptional regulator